MNFNFSNKRKYNSMKKLLGFLTKRFLEGGFNNFSITEVANQLKISKKTIYKAYRTKEEIIRIILIKQLSVIYSDVSKIIKSETNIVRKLNDLSVIIEEYFIVFNELSINRLAQYFPELADYIAQFKSNRIIPLIEILLNIGKKNFLIADIPNEVIIKVFTSSLTSIVEAKNQFSSTEAYHLTFRNAFSLLMLGTLTDIGKKFYHYKSEVKNENN